MAKEREILILEEFLPYRLSVLSNMVSSAIAATYSERFGLSIPAWRVMAILGRFPGLSAAEVAERTAMDKVAVSRAVSQLLRDGRVERTFADEDRRRSVLRLSPRGYEVYDQVVPLALEYEHRFLDGIDPADRAALKRLMDLLMERATMLAER
ncbi:MAG TPA: MarR family transcriptional regulator [Sphingomonadales bacterium]